MLYFVLLTLIDISTIAGNCTDGTLRLADGVDDPIMDTTEGRLELCLNNAWGTICDNAFGIPDAQVACNQLVGYQKEGKISIFKSYISNIIISKFKTLTFSRSQYCESEWYCRQCPNISRSVTLQW